VVLGGYGPVGLLGISTRPWTAWLNGSHRVVADAVDPLHAAQPRDRLAQVHSVVSGRWFTVWRREASRPSPRSPDLRH